MLAFISSSIRSSHIDRFGAALLLPSWLASIDRCPANPAVDRCINSDDVDDSIGAASQGRLV